MGKLLLVAGMLIAVLCVMYFLPPVNNWRKSDPTRDWPGKYPKGYK